MTDTVKKSKISKSSIKNLTHQSSCLVEKNNVEMPARIFSGFFWIKNYFPKAIFENEIF